MGTHRPSRGAEGRGLTPGAAVSATGAGPAWRNVHGRRRGKALKPAQARAMREVLPRIAIGGVDRFENPGRARLEPAALFGDARPLWLEIGFGGGEHLLHQAAAHPQNGLIGCEPFLNGVAKTVTRIAAEGVDNVRIHAGDARDLLDVLPDAALARVFLLYPDPWPKTRHKGRRFVNAENLAALARVMAPGAELRLATDIADYAAHARAAFAADPAFSEPATAAGAGTPWTGWPSTRYEAKALRAGRAPRYLTFLRRSGPDPCAPVDRSGAIA